MSGVTVKPDGMNGNRLVTVESRAVRFTLIKIKLQWYWEEK